MSAQIFNITHIKRELWSLVIWPFNSSQENVFCINLFRSVPYFSENDPNFYLEVDSGNFTNVNLNASDRIVAYWSIGISISVAMTTPGVLDIFFEIPQSYQGNQTQGLFGKTEEWPNVITSIFSLRTRVSKVVG